MVRNPFSSRTAGLSPEDALELANKHLGNARKEGDVAKALEHMSTAKTLLIDAEKKKAKDPVLSEGIAGAFHEHGVLLDELGYHDKAKKSHSRAEKLGYVCAVSRHTGSSQPVGNGGTIRPSLLPTTPTTSITVAMHQDSSKSDDAPLNHQYRTRHGTPAELKNGRLTPYKDVAQIAPKILDQNIAPPVIKYALPEAGGRITSTPQLAYCLSLLHPSMISKEELSQSERDWVQARVVDPDEHERLQTMVTDLTRAFIREELKKPDVIAEVVSLAAVLGQDDFRKLLQAFVDGINQSLLLDIHLLDGLTQLIRNAAQGYLDADDLVKILELLNARLKDTHKQSTQYTYRLALTISQVLDSMVDSQVKGLRREQLHEPLSDYLNELQRSSDPYLVYQVAYAYQALQYIPDDETVLQSVMRRTGKVVHGISGVVSAVKALDLIRLFEGLQNVQESLAGAEKAFGLVKDVISNVMLAENGQGLLASLKEGFSFNRKSSWYPALRGLDRLVQEGRFADFEILVRGAPCQHSPAFRWGVCQRLGEIAANTIWHHNIRKRAVDFLKQLYKDNASHAHQVGIKQWILYILNQLAKSSRDIIAGSTRELLQEAQANSSGKGILYHDRGNDSPELHPIMVAPPPMESPLLNYIQNKPDVETPLRQLMRERLKGRGGHVYISPRAKAIPKATDDFDLTTKVQEFLASDRKVFLILGDSGAGKSTFNRALEISLWDKYEKTTGRIPLFINLSAVDKPEKDLIDKHLRKVNFTETQIRELKVHREFIIICDGYDESQQTRNLYTSNQLNQPRGWRVQMVISCRTEYNGIDYKHCFEPSDRNSSGEAELFQEATISPFDKDQIQAYVEQYVLLRNPPWGSDDYQQALKQIPSLQGLVKNPFLLRLALEVLPRILGNDSKFPTARITRIELYDEFVAQWIERGKKRLTEMELNSRDKLAFKHLSNSGFQQRSIMYLKELVTAIYDNNRGKPVVNYSEHQDRRTWKEAFFSERDEIHLLREVIPLTRNGDQYRFIHRSLLEYGLALAIFGPSKHNEDPRESPCASRRGSISSVLSFESSTKRTATADEQSLLDSPLGKRNLVGETSVLQFLTERVQQEPVFKDQLLLAIERSKSDETVRTAAANAITILVRAGVQFNGADLRNIKIPRADLSFGVFDSAQLEGADLRKANLRNIWMRQANLRGAKMDGVLFGELPFLQEDGGVLCCAYSPDGEIYSAGLDSGNIHLYETTNWNRIHTLAGHSGSVNSLSFSATGHRIASGSDDKTVRLWDVDTGKCVRTWQGHKAAYSPKGDQIASGGGDLTVRLWDADTGEYVLTWRGHSGWVRGDETVQLRDVDTGECVHALQGHSGWVRSVVYSPKGGRIASGSGDKTVRLWNVDTGECVRTFQGHSGWVRSVVYSPKGDRIASGSDDLTVRLWDVDTGECVRTLQGHSGWVRSVVYSPKGDRIASGSDDLTVRLWEVDDGECVHTWWGHSGWVRSVAYSPKRHQIASGSIDKTVRVWDVDTGESVHAWQAHSDWARRVTYSPKGDQIASGGSDNTVRLWDVDTGECVRTLLGHSSYVASVVYSPKGDQIASGGGDKTVRLWDVDTGECVHTLQGHTSYAFSVVYSPKGDQIASGSGDKTVRVWDVGTGECVHTLQGHSGWVRSVVYSPKGGQIASGSGDKTVRLWDVSAGECVRTLQGHSSSVRSVVYSPKGDRIASGGVDMTVRLWDVDAGKCIHTLRGHSSDVYNVMYSPKGDQIASGSIDKTVRLWDVDTGECIHTLRGHRGNVYGVVYSPKGDWIASRSDDRTAKLWNVETGQCLVTISGFSDLVSGIDWENNFGAQCLVTVSFDKSVRRWRITKEGDVYKAILCWSSSHEVLTAFDVSFEDVRDLSRWNQELLIQRGALIPKPLLSER